MRKTGRILAALLILALLCGMIPAAGAEVVTVGVYFSGRRIAEDGSESFVKLEGSFRVIQNGSVCFHNACDIIGFPQSSFDFQGGDPHFDEFRHKIQSAQITGGKEKSLFPICIFVKHPAGLFAFAPVSAGIAPADP